MPDPRRPSQQITKEEVEAAKAAIRRENEERARAGMVPKIWRSNHKVKDFSGEKG